MLNFNTTNDFINSRVTVSAVSAGEIIKTFGYTTSGGVGGARWKATGNVIAVSQDPLALNDIKLSDASGNEYELVVEEAGIIDLNVLGGTSASYENIATTAGLTFSQGLTSDVSNDIVNIDTAQNLIDRNGVSVGEAFAVADRASGIFDAKTGLTANGYDILQSSTDGSIQYEYRNKQKNSSIALGVVSDGVTDDTAALKNAIEFVADNNSELRIEKGSGSILVSNIQITSKSNFTISGNATILGTSAQTELIRFTNCDNVTIKGSPQLSFDMGVTEYSITWPGPVYSRVLSFITCNDITVDNCKADDGFIINPSPAAPGTGPIDDEVLIGVLAYVENCKRVKINDNRVDGVDLFSGSGTRNVDIHRNECGNSTANGGVTSIFSSNCSAMSITENNIEYVNITGRGGFFFAVQGSIIDISNNTGEFIAGNNNGHAVYAQELNKVNIEGNIWIQNGDLSIRDCNDVVVDGNLIDATDASNGTIYAIRYEGVTFGGSEIQVRNNTFDGVSGFITGGTANVSNVYLSNNVFNISRSNYIKYQASSTSLTNMEVRDNRAISTQDSAVAGEPFVDFEGQLVSGTVRIIDNTHIRTNGYTTQVSQGESFEFGLISNLPDNYEVRGNGNQYIMPSTEPILEDGLIGDVTYTEVIGTVNDPDTSTPVASALQRLDDLTCTVAIGGQTYKIKDASIDFTNGLLSAGGIANLMIDAGGGITPTTQTTFVGLQLLRFTRDGTYPKVATGVDTSYSSPRSRLKAGDGLEVQILTAAPSNIVDGLMIYADGTSFNPGSGAGFYGRQGGAWVKL